MIKQKTVENQCLYQKYIFVSKTGLFIPSPSRGERIFHSAPLQLLQWRASFSTSRKRRLGRDQSVFLCCSPQMEQAKNTLLMINL